MASDIQRLYQCPVMSDNKVLAFSLKCHYSTTLIVKWRKFLRAETLFGFLVETDELVYHRILLMHIDMEPHFWYIIHLKIKCRIMIFKFETHCC